MKYEIFVDGVKRTVHNSKRLAQVMQRKLKQAGAKTIKIRPVKIKRRYARNSAIPRVSSDTTVIYSGSTRDGKKIYYRIYGVYTTPELAQQYAADYESQGMGKARVYDLGKKAGRPRYAVFVIEKSSVNPSKKVSVRLKHKLKRDWYVDLKRGDEWEPVAAFKRNKKQEAVEYAKAYANQHNIQTKVYRS